MQLLACSKDQHLVVPPNIVETVWDLWQTAPLLCSLEIPVVMKRAAVFKTQIEFRGVVSLSRAHQFEYFVEPTRKANGNKRDNITLSALQDGPKAVRARRLAHEHISVAASHEHAFVDASA